MADDPKNGPQNEDPEPDELDETDADGQEGEEGGDGGEPEWTAPTREQWDAQNAALEAEKAKLKRARAQAERLRKGAGTTGDAGAAAEGTQPAAADGPNWQRRAVRGAAKAELLDRGAAPETVGLMLEKLKPNTVTFDEDDEPELDDYLDEMQDKYPTLFKSAPAAPAAERPRPGRVEQGAPAAGRPARPKLSLGQQIIAQSEAARRSGRRGL